MNEAGQARCEALQSREESPLELRRRLILTRNLSTLCHCSSEIDQGTLLYFSVNNMFLGSGNYLLILFSEVSEISEAQRSGMDIYGRMFAYALIEEEITRSFSGHFTFYSCELDGRLVVLVLFHYGLLPAHRKDLVNIIGRHCAELSHTCRQKYDMNVVAYISEVMDQVPILSSVYHKLLSVATLHRYLHKQLDDPVYYMLRPGCDSPSPYRLPVQECAKSIANALVDQGDYRSVLDRTLEAMTENPLQSTDELKSRFGDLFEALCAQLKARGVRLQTDRLRNEQMRLLMEESHWEQPVAWLYETVDRISSSCRTDNHAVFKHNLERAQQYIRDHLTSPTLSAKEVADAVGISSTSLSITFRQQLQITPAKYIRDRRLERAIELLQAADTSVQAVCAACGFGSLETFHRVFKAEFGTTPGSLKRLSQVK